MRFAVFFILLIASGYCQELSSVRYLLWTRSNTGDEEFFDLLPFDVGSISDSPFNGTKRTQFAFHGWQFNGLASFILEAKTETLVAEDVNFVSVDWEEFADSLVFEISERNTYEVSNYTAEVLDFLVENSELQFSNIHLWGHSLGGQAAGMVGHRVTGGVIDRITGLDPAGGDWSLKEPGERLDKTSGAFVDIIHTNGGLIDDGFAGMVDAVAHADFYPNGGSKQPGCDSGVPDAISNCSHLRANKYFIESINSMIPFKSYECTTYNEASAGNCSVECGIGGCNEMGYHTFRRSGIFYLETNSEAPFAQI